MTTKREKQDDFDRWARELDYRCENRPVMFPFHLESGPSLTTVESQIIQENLVAYELRFKDKKLCANPDCRYPLEDNGGFYVAEFGSCCWLCHDMDSALRQTKRGTFFSTIREWFEAAHSQWKIDQERVNKIKKGEDDPGPGGFTGFF
jgi:hypothetical protein